MKNFACKNHINKCLSALSMAAVVALSSACDNHAKADGSVGAQNIEAERPESSLDMLMRALSEGDAQGFASMCVYPIQRIYPLRCIEDSATMVDYFPVMVDDSLKSIAKKSKAKDWNYYGWRGWALGDSTILWFDDGLQFVDYESKAETGLRKMLARNEIMTLLPEYRDGWTPVETLVETDGDKIFRIDSSDEGFRLMEYENADSLRGTPALVLLGTLSTEGSADYRTFLFTDSIGTKAEYMPDAEPPVKIDITGPDKKMKSHKVHRGYWRDILR